MSNLPSNCLWIIIICEVCRLCHGLQCYACGGLSAVNELCCLQDCPSEYDTCYTQITVTGTGEDTSVLELQSCGQTSGIKCGETEENTLAGVKQSVTWDCCYHDKCNVPSKISTDTNCNPTDLKCYTCVEGDPSCPLEACIGIADTCWMIEALGKRSLSCGYKAGCGQPYTVEGKPSDGTVQCCETTGCNKPKSSPGTSSENKDSENTGSKKKSTSSSGVSANNMGSMVALIVTFIITCLSW